MCVMKGDKTKQRQVCTFSKLRTHRGIKTNKTSDFLICAAYFLCYFHRAFVETEAEKGLLLTGMGNAAGSDSCDMNDLLRRQPVI